MHTLLIAIILALTCAAMLAGYSVYLLWRDQYSGKARAFAKRIDAVGKGKAVSAGDVSILKQTARTERANVAQAGVLRIIDWSLRHAGLNWSLSRFGLYTAIGALAGAMVGVVLGLPRGICAAPLCAGAALPYGFVRYLSRKRAVKMEKQLPDVLDMMASMLRAGNTLPATLALLAEELPAPIGEEFRALHGEITYGGSIEDGLNHLIERTRSDDLRCLVMAVLVQRETGGNLTEVLADLSGVVRERLKLQGKIRALSAEGRLSAWVLTFLPFVVALAMNIILPDYLSLFWQDPTGIKMMYAMLVMLMVGNLWMRRIIQVRV
jgi:tight adherence protein B